MGISIEASPRLSSLEGRRGMILMAFLWSSYAQALPLGPDSINYHNQPRKNSVYTDPTYGTSTQGRLAYGLVSFACLFSLAFVLGLRVKSFDKKKIQLAWLLVHLQTMIALGLVISSSVLVVTFGTTTQEQCFSAIMVCVVFYATAKMCLYMFLLERAHVVRAPFIRKRTDDWVWVGGTSFVLVAFGAIAIWSLITPHAELSAEDGQCRIGLATVPAYLLLIFDALINASLNIVFVVLLRPVLKCRERTSPYYDDGSTLPSVSHLRRLIRQLGSLGFKEEEFRDKFSINIKKVLRKNVIGSSISFLASGANLAIFLSEKGNQLAFVCLVACMADVTCGVLVVHWLTLGSNDAPYSPQRPNRNHTSSLSASSTVAAISKPEDTVRLCQPKS